MHTMKLTKIGGGTGMILPVAFLAALGVERGDSVHLTPAPGGGFRITPFNPTFAQQMEAARAIMKKRREALRELAK